MPLLGLAVLAERLQEGHDIVDVLFVLKAREGHLGARHLGFGILEVDLQGRLVPGQARVLVGLGKVVARIGAGLAAHHAIEHGTDGVLGILSELVAGLADLGLLGARDRVPGASVLCRRRLDPGKQNHGRDTDVLTHPKPPESFDAQALAPGRLPCQSGLTGWPKGRGGASAGTSPRRAKHGGRLHGEGRREPTACSAAPRIIASCT